MRLEPVLQALYVADEIIEKTFAQHRPVDSRDWAPPSRRRQRLSKFHDLFEPGRVDVLRTIYNQRNRHFSSAFANG